MFENISRKKILRKYFLVSFFHFIQKIYSRCRINLIQNVNFNTNFKLKNIKIIVLFQSIKKIIFLGRILKIRHDQIYNIKISEDFLLIKQTI